MIFATSPGWYTLFGAPATNCVTGEQSICFRSEPIIGWRTIDGGKAEAIRFPGELPIHAFVSPEGQIWPTKLSGMPSRLFNQP